MSTLTHRAAASCPRRPTPSPAPTWSATPAPAATSTRSTGTTGWPRSVGLPGVIAHGMFTMALAAARPRHLGRRPRPGPSSCGCKFTKPVVVPDDDDRRRGARSRGTVKNVDGRGACSVALEVTCGGEKVLGAAEGRVAACLSGPPSAARRPAPPCASGGPARRAACTATTEDELRRRRPPGRRGGHAAAARRRRQQPRGRRRRLRRHRRATSRRAASRSSPDTCGGAMRDASRRASRGTTLVAPGGRRGLGRRRGAVRHPRAASARPRSRTSAPTARRSPTPSPRSAAGTASTGRGSARSPPPTAASATAPAASSRTPSRYVVLAVTFQLRLGDLSAPGALRRAGPRRSASRSATARRWPRCATPCSALRRRQGHGARRRRPRHLERRLVLHQPAARRRAGGAGCPRGRPAGSSPTAPVKTSAAWLIEHAGLRQGLRQRPGRACPPSTRSRSPTGAPPRTADLLDARRRGARRGAARRFGVCAGQRAGPGRRSLPTRS